MPIVISRQTLRPFKSEPWLYCVTPIGLRRSRSRVSPPGSSSSSVGFAAGQREMRQHDGRQCQGNDKWFHSVFIAFIV